MTVTLHVEVDALYVDFTNVFIEHVLSESKHFSCFYD